MGNVEYTFFAITPESTLNLSDRVPSMAQINLFQSDYYAQIDLLEKHYKVVCQEKKKESKRNTRKLSLFVCLFVGFYGISTLLSYLMPNPFLCK